MNDVSQLKELLQSPRTICITSHRNPDGDAIGSSLAMKHALDQLGHRCFIVTPSAYPDNFEWMPGAHSIQFYDLDPEEAKSTVDKSEVIFCLDYNSLDRIDKLGAYIENTVGKQKVMIDHHMDPEPIADIMISRPEASSTCEMVFDVLSEMGYANLMNLDVVTCLYVGILTDTGSFKHATSAHVFEVMAELKRRGLDDYYVNDQIFNSVKEKNLRLLGNALLNRLEILAEHKAGIIYLTKEDYEVYDIQRGDTEGIVNYILSIKGIQLAAFVMEQPKIVKISLRSKYDVNVQKLARENFNGGGHKNASGGYTFETLENAISRLKRVIPKYVNN